MVVRLRIPLVLRKYTGHKEYIETGPGKITDILIDVSKIYPGLASRILEGDNKLKGNTLLFLDKEKPEVISDMGYYIKDGQTIKIIMVTGGG